MCRQGPAAGQLGGNIQSAEALVFGHGRGLGVGAHTRPGAGSSGRCPLAVPSPWCPPVPTPHCSCHACLPPRPQVPPGLDSPSFSYAHPRTWQEGGAQRRLLSGIIIGLGMEGSALRRPLVQSQKTDIWEGFRVSFTMRHLADISEQEGLASSSSFITCRLCGLKEVI